MDDRRHRLVEGVEPGLLGNLARLVQQRKSWVLQLMLPEQQNELLDRYCIRTPGYYNQTRSESELRNDSR